jgi:hypothetical protein
MTLVALILGSVLLFAANLLLWVNSTILDGEEFTETVSTVLNEPEVKERLAEVLVAQLLENEEIEQQIVERVPERYTFVVPVVKTQIGPALEQVAVRALDSDFIGGVRDEIILAFHQRLLAVLESDDTALQVQGEALVLDLTVVWRNLLERINVTPPERLGGDEGPSRLLGGDGTVVLLEDTSGLQQVSFFVQNSTTFALILLGASGLAFAGAVLLTRDRRRGVLHVGYALAGVGVGTLLILFIANRVLDSAAEERVVLLELVSVLETNLKLQALAIALVGACTIAVTDRGISARLVALEDQARVAFRGLDIRIAFAVGSLVILVLVLF